MNIKEAKVTCKRKLVRGQGNMQKGKVTYNIQEVKVTCKRSR